MRRYSNLIIIVVSVFFTLFLFKSFMVRVPLVPVTSFYSTVFDFTTQNATSVVVLKKFALKNINGNSPVVCNDLDELKVSLEKNKKLVAFVPWYMVTPQLKTIRYNGKYFWDNEKKINYLSVKKIIFNPAEKYSSNAKTNITIGGTVVLSRGVGNVIERTNDIYYPWQGITPFFQKADCAIVNLKSPLVYNYIKPNSTWSLYGKAKYAPGLQKSGIDIVSIAGNHIGDAGVQGILDTQSILDNLKIKYAGTSTDNRKAYTPVVHKLPQFSIGFLAINGVGGSKYTDVKGQAVYVAGLNEALVKQAIADLKKSVDIVIVMPNWGDEYVSVPNQTQVKWGKFLIENGADIVVGDQAHWVQKAAFYQDKFISYGLGNLIFDQAWSKETMEGAIERFIFYRRKN